MTPSDRSRDNKKNYIEGKHAILELFRAGGSLEELYIAQDIRDDATTKEILSFVKKENIRTKQLPKRELDRLSDRGAHQGLIAKMKPYAFTSLQNIFSAAEGKAASLVIALDHITDPGNFGAIVRSAEVIGADGIIVPSRRSAAVTAGAYKASAGAFAHIKIAQETNLVRSLEACKNQGYWIVGADEKATDICWDASLEGRIVLVMGAEDEGLSQLVRQTCDLLVKLPQYGKVASLNVAQATTALAYEWARRSRERR